MQKNDEEEDLFVWVVPVQYVAACPHYNCGALLFELEEIKECQFCKKEIEQGHSHKLEQDFIPRLL